jgi:flagellar basal body-associated protein FliL
VAKRRRSGSKQRTSGQPKAGRLLIPIGLALVVALIVGAVIMAISADDAPQQADTGERAPNIALEDARGDQFELSAVLARNDHTVVLFYRGFG